MYHKCKLLYLKYIKKIKDFDEKDLNDNLLIQNLELV
jgi:hypothetical protein